jgi:hypothetical protein
MVNRKSIHFIDTWGDAKDACAVIRTKSLVGLDIELDQNNTNASLIQFAVSATEAYIFDVMVLGQQLFDASYLLPILCDPRITKLCYDCRGDSETLFRKHGARVYGLYDLQIVFTSLYQCPSDPHLKGISHAARVALPYSPKVAGFAAGKMRMKRCFREGGKKFVRPLSEETLRYCAEDTTILVQMHEFWRNYVDFDEVLIASSLRAKRHIFRTASAHRYPMYMVDFSWLNQCCFFE